MPILFLKEKKGNTAKKRYNTNQQFSLTTFILCLWDTSLFLFCVYFIFCTVFFILYIFYILYSMYFIYSYNLCIYTENIC